MSRHATLHTISHGIVRVGAYRIDIWEGSGRPGLPSQDTHLTVPLEGRLRLAAIDGVTPGPGARWPAGEDSAVWASEVTRAALRADLDLADCLAQANAAVLDERLDGRDRPQATVAACDLRPDDTALLIRAGDCEAWALTAGGWRACLPHPAMIADQAAARWRAWKNAHPEATLAELVEHERELYRDPSQWVTAPIGLFAEPRTHAAEVSGVIELVLASDGARLTPERVARLDAWMEEMRAWEIEHADATGGSKLHDDLTVLRVRRA